MKKLNLEGQRFGKLTVIKAVNVNGVRKWHCHCDCGNECDVITGSLTSGNSTSCGNCKNFYNLSGEYGVGYTSKGEEFYFDLEDYDKIKDYCWYIDKTGYVRNRNGLLLHRIVTNCPNNLVPDHINGKQSRNYNRKANLRLATRNQNTYNHAVYSNSKTQKSGVTWSNFHQKWLVRIGFNKKRVHIGYFDNFEEAIKARDDAEKMLYKEWRYNNEP